MVMDGITQFETEQIDQRNTSGLTPSSSFTGSGCCRTVGIIGSAAFAAAGYATLAPGWPDDPETVKEGNEHPERFAGKTVGEIADHMEAVISKLSKPPALIGHSFGGLLVQILAGRGLSKATVAIDPAPFQGVLPLPISALKSASPVLKNPTNHSQAVALTFDQFRYAFANEVGEDEAKELYETYAVPGTGRSCSRRRLRTSTRGPRSKVDSKNPNADRCSIISGEKDHTVPWAIANAATRSRSATRASPRSSRSRAGATRW